MRTKKRAAGAAEPKTSGSKLVEKYRPRMSGLTSAQRQKLTAAGNAEFEAAMKKVLQENAGLMRRLAQ